MHLLHGLELHQPLDRPVDHRVQPLVVDPPRRDALVDDVRLLKEELPGSHGRAHDRHCAIAKENATGDGHNSSNYLF